MLLLKHVGRQLGEILFYCWVNQVWWPVPLLAVLFVAAIASCGSQAVAPYIYTLF